MVHQAGTRTRGRQRRTACATSGVLTPCRHHTLSGLGSSQSSTRRSRRMSSYWRVSVTASGRNPRVRAGTNHQPSSLSHARTRVHRHAPRTTTSGSVPAPANGGLICLLIQAIMPRPVARAKPAPQSLWSAGELPCRCARCSDVALSAASPVGETTAWGSAQVPAQPKRSPPGDLPSAGGRQVGACPTEARGRDRPRARPRCQRAGR